jgi:hypothetical protein
MSQNRWSFDASTASAANIAKIGSLSTELVNNTGATLTPVSSPMTPVGAGYYSMPTTAEGGKVLSFTSLNPSPGVFYLDMYAYWDASPGARWVPLSHVHYSYGYDTYSWVEITGAGQLNCPVYYNVDAGYYYDNPGSIVVPSGERFRLQIGLSGQVDAYSGSLTVRLFKGANLNGTTPDATLSSVNASVAAGGTFTMFGTTGRNLYVDDIILDDSGYPSRAASFNQSVASQHHF